MASDAGDPSEDLCANMLEGCTKLKALLLKLKESLLRDKAAVRLQAACAWIPRMAAGAASTREQANRLYMSPSVGGGRAAPSNRHAGGHLLGAVGRCSTQGQHRRRTRACGAAHHSAQKGNHGRSRSDNHPHEAASRLSAPR